MVKVSYTNVRNIVATLCNFDFVNVSRKEREEKEKFNE